MSEDARLAFIEDRDGEEAMLKFAEQMVYCYVIDLVNCGKYKDNIDEGVRVLESRGKRVRFVVIDEAPAPEEPIDHE